MHHEYFADAVDPLSLRPRSSTARLLGRKQSEKSVKSPTKESYDSPALSSKPSWFRRSLIGRTDGPTLEPEQPSKPAFVPYESSVEAQGLKPKQASTKRATWAHGAPMPILPSIRPVSPLSNAVTAQAKPPAHEESNGAKSSKKIGRQLSVNSHGNHYGDLHRQEAERALNGGANNGGASNQKESFFSHLRKRARRLSGRNQNVMNDDIEANAGCMPWSNRSSLALDSVNVNDTKQNSDLSELDNALQNVKYSTDSAALGNVPVSITSPSDSIKRQSMPQGSVRSMADSPVSTGNGGPISSRTRRAMQMTNHPVHRYETPEEEDELLDEVLHSASSAARRLAQGQMSDTSSNYSRQLANEHSHPLPSPYPTPSPSAKCDDATPNRGLPLSDGKTDPASATCQWPTPPYDDNDWVNTASTRFLTGSTYR